MENLWPLRRVDYNAHCFGLCPALSLIAALASNTMLVEVALCRAGLKDYHVLVLCTALGGNATLRSIALDDNLITDKGALALLEHVKGKSVLRRVSLEGNPIPTDLKTQYIQWLWLVSIQHQEMASENRYYKYISAERVHFIV
eukprot:EG_transcript_35575